jgi:sec-independent protein translocase protein TatA
MHMPSIWGLLIVVVLAFLLFGRPGKLSGMMEDFGKGIRGFRKGLSESDTPPPPQDPPRQVPDQTTTTSNQDRA